MLHHGYPSLDRIQAHLEELRRQEKDALEVLSQPESKPGMHAQLRGLIQRIREERRGLQKSVGDLMTAGKLQAGSVY